MTDAASTAPPSSLLMETEGTRPETYELACAMFDAAYVTEAEQARRDAEAAQARLEATNAQHASAGWFLAMAERDGECRSILADLPPPAPPPPAPAPLSRSAKRRRRERGRGLA